LLTVKAAVRTVLCIAALVNGPGTCGQAVAAQESKSEQLLVAAKRGDVDATLALGELGEDVVEPLRQLLAQSGLSEYSLDAVRTALAKLGDESQFAIIKAQLTSESPMVQRAAVKKMVYVGGRRGFGALVELLAPSYWIDTSNQTSAPTGVRDRVVFLPLGYVAMSALIRTAPNSAVPREAEPNQADAAVWEKWWLEVGSKL
jgi:hypothetical protein